MPIEIQDYDHGIGNVIESKEVVTDQELIGSLKRHLAHDRKKIKQYK